MNNAQKPVFGAFIYKRGQIFTEGNLGTLSMPAFNLVDETGDVRQSTYANIGFFWIYPRKMTMVNNCRRALAEYIGLA